MLVSPGNVVRSAPCAHPRLTAACGAEIFEHAARIEAIAAEAKARYAPDADWGPRELALFTQQRQRAKGVTAVQRDRMIENMQDAQAHGQATASSSTGAVLPRSSVSTR